MDGEIIAGLLSSDIIRSNETSLFIDFGTEVIIALGSKDKVVYTRLNPEPIFAGADYSHSMRASKGAIDQIIIGDDVLTHTIQSSPASGLAVSGLLCAVSEFLSKGFIERSGKFTSKISDDDIPYAIGRRFREDERGVRFILYSSGEKEISIRERDIGMFLDASRQVGNEIEKLCERADIRFEDIVKIIIAGAFGVETQVQDLNNTGIIKPVDEEKIHFIGNASLEGAVMCLLGREELSRTAKAVSLGISA